MNPGETVFAQLLQQISHYQFRKIVDQNDFLSGRYKCLKILFRNV